MYDRNSFSELLRTKQENRAMAQKIKLRRAEQDKMEELNKWSIATLANQELDGGYTLKIERIDEHESPSPKFFHCENYALGFWACKFEVGALILTVRMREGNYLVEHGPTSCAAKGYTESYETTEEVSDRLCEILSDLTACPFVRQS